MSVTLPVIYEQGILRPLAPLTLPESSRITVQIVDQEPGEYALSFQRALTDLRRLLQSVEQNWSNALVRQVFVQLLEPQLRTLWRFAPPFLSELCGLLVLAASHVDAKQLTHAQLQALHFGVSLLTHPTVTDADLDEVQDRCILAGIPPALTFPAVMVQSYIDEL